MHGNNSNKNSYSSSKSNKNNNNSNNINKSSNNFNNTTTALRILAKHGSLYTLFFAESYKTKVRDTAVNTYTNVTNKSVDISMKLNNNKIVKLHEDST